MYPNAAINATAVAVAAAARHPVRALASLLYIASIHRISKRKGALALPDTLVSTLSSRRVIV